MARKRLDDLVAALQKCRVAVLDAETSGSSAEPQKQALRGIECEIRIHCEEYGLQLPRGIPEGL